MADEMTKAVADHAQADLANVGAPGRYTERATSVDMGPKWGEGHAMGMLRLGGHELTQALAAFPESNVRPMEEPGVFGNPTPQIVTQDMGYDHNDYLDSLKPNVPAVAREQDKGMER